MRKLFPRMVLEDGEEKFRIDPAEVRRHALMVVEGLGLAVDYLQDNDKLNRFLRIVGTRHHHANVKPEMLTKLYPAMDEGLHDVLGKGYTKRQRQAFRSFFMYIVGVFKIAMMEAASSSSQHAMRDIRHSNASWSSGIGTASTCSTKSIKTLE
ncbi:hypothetical protein C0Q70_13797 [Pomacea canaliculata]|uniref:Globin n=2 Tax=Pomacea canaliculata TaxID=400727 RepID=A0A2T7NY86_POMCA|nr:hypothetical protein C0Q70_13797 [Pomacea canaliculata]